jgi:hypothetical protein
MHTSYHLPSLVPVLLMTPHHHGLSDPVFLEPGDDHVGTTTLLLKGFLGVRWMLAQLRQMDWET